MSNIISNVPSFPDLQQQTGRSIGPDKSESEGQFGGVLKNAIDQVQQLQSSAEQQVAELLKGQRGDVHNVVIAVEKADVAFQLMMQVRNKIVNAYQEISKMQF